MMSLIFLTYCVGVSLCVLSRRPPSDADLQCSDSFRLSAKSFSSTILPSLFATFVKSVKTTKHKLCDRKSFVYIEERKRRSAAAFLIITMNLNEVQIKVVPYPHRDLSWKDFLFFFFTEDFNFLLARRLLSFSFYCEFFSYYSSQLNEGHDGTDPSAPHSLHYHGHPVCCVLYANVPMSYHQELYYHFGKGLDLVGGGE